MSDRAYGLKAPPHCRYRHAGNRPHAACPEEADLGRRAAAKLILRLAPFTGIRMPHDVRVCDLRDDKYAGRKLARIEGP